MLDLLFYLLAAVLAGLAVFLPPSVPFDRVRLLAAAFCAFTIPFVIHAGR